VEQKLLLVGCGKMGGALLAGWLGRDIDPTNVAVVEPYGADALRDQFEVTVVESLQDLEPGFMPNIIVFAVKPQAMDEIVPLYAGFVNPETMFLSIAA